MRDTGRTRAAALLGVGALAMVAIGGCGDDGEDKFENAPRPPVPVQLTGVITSEEVTISPDELPLEAKEGAQVSEEGLPTPIVLTISNQTEDPHAIKLSGKTTDGGKPIEADVPAINPGDTAQLQQSLPPGTYQIEATNPEGAVDAGDVPQAAELKVNENTQTSSGDLLLP
jgi:hypothetical protein